MRSFWRNFPKPFLVQAPLEGVTDTVFRQIIASCARPDVFFTEFTSAEGFRSQGKTAVMENFRHTSREHPLVAQIWGRNPDTVYETCREIAGSGFAGIDLNMGCPVRAVTRLGCGAAMIGLPGVAKEIINAAKRGIGDGNPGIPLSVKTRIGIHDIETERWIGFLLEQELDALTIHCRTADERSKAPAHWEEIGRAVELRNHIRPETQIIGNGDVMSVREAMGKHDKYGCDGIMIGRGIFANPWVFDRGNPPHEGGPLELLELCRRHILLWAETWGERKPFAPMRKFFKMYIKGFEGAPEVRDKIMRTKNPAEALEALSELGKSLGG